MESNELVFKFNTQKERLFLNIILSFFILVFGTVGFFLTITSVTMLLSNSFESYHIVMGFGGVTCIFLVLFLRNFMSGGVYIVESKFNQNEKRFEIKESNGDTSFIPYSEIKQFSIKVEVESSSNDDSPSRTIYYVVYMHKKDGAIIAIDWFYNQQKAKDLLDRLNQAIPIDNSALPESDFGSSINRPKGVFFEKQGFSAFQLKWKNKLSSYYAFIGFGTLLSFLATFSSIVFVIDVGWLFKGIFLFVASIFIAVVLYHLYKLLVIKEYLLEVTSTDMIYSYNTIYGKKVVSQMKISDLFGTQVNLERDKYNNPNREIWIVSKEIQKKIEDVYAKESTGSDFLGLVKAMIELRLKVMNLEFPGFSFVELLHIEKMIDEELKQHN